MVNQRVYLSSPHNGADEAELVREAFATNWIAPRGPHVDAFKREFAISAGAKHAAALSFGTALPALRDWLQLSNEQRARRDRTWPVAFATGSRGSAAGELRFFSKAICGSAGDRVHAGGTVGTAYALPDVHLVRSDAIWRRSRANTVGV